MKGIRKRILASAMAFTMIGFDLTSVLATEIETEVVEETEESGDFVEDNSEEAGASEEE